MKITKNGIIAEVPAGAFKEDFSKRGWKAVGEKSLAKQKQRHAEQDEVDEPGAEDEEAQGEASKAEELLVELRTADVDRLKEIAVEHSVDVSGLTTKKEYKQAIRAALLAE